MFISYLKAQTAEGNTFNQISSYLRYLISEERMHTHHTEPEMKIAIISDKR